MIKNKYKQDKKSKNKEKKINKKNKIMIGNIQKPKQDKKTGNQNGHKRTQKKSKTP